MSDPTPEPDEPTEPDLPDTEGAGEDEPTPDETPMPEPPVDAPPPVDMEKAFKALDREHSRHEKRVAEIMGPDFEIMRLCAICDGLGFMGPDAAVIEAYRVDPTTGEIALVVTGERPDALYQDNPQTQRCETCDGRGQVKTGARPEANPIGQCPDCGGQGWRLRTNVTPMPQPVAQPSNDPGADALRAQGYTVIPPYQAPPASP